MMAPSVSRSAVPDKPEPQHAIIQSSGEELLERLRALAERTDGIAHDLNNMLGTMIGYGALVLEDLPADDPNHVFVAKVMEAGAEAKRLIADLMDEANAETARVKGPAVQDCLNLSNPLDRAGEPYQAAAEDG
jgi:signal transduction histidine kinase